MIVAFNSDRSIKRWISNTVSEKLGKTEGSLIGAKNSDYQFGCSTAEPGHKTRRSLLPWAVIASELAELGLETDEKSTVPLIEFFEFIEFTALEEDFARAWSRDTLVIFLYLLRLWICWRV